MSKYDLKLEGNAFQKFMLQHAEKVVLGAGAVLAIALIWLGVRTPVFNQTTPEQLSQEARRAGEHIHSTSSWEQIRPHRAVIKDTETRIAQLVKTVDTSNYKLSYIRGVPAKALGLRLDPELLPAEQLEVRSFRAPLVVKFTNEALNTLRLATHQDEASTADDRRRRDQVKIDAGETMPEQQEKEMVGVRPRTATIDSTFNPYVKDFVVVTGLVPIQEQAERFREALASAQAYYPPEDRPIYRRLEVQRRVEGGDWETLTERQMQPDFLPAQNAPEVIDPNYYDEVLTRPIPMIALIDYRPWATHSKVPLRRYVPAAVKKDFEGKMEEVKKDDNPFNRPRTEDSGEAGASGQSTQGSTGGSEPANDIETLKGSNLEVYARQSKSLRPKAPFKLVRFFDVEPPLDKPVQYRFRLWLFDSNQRDIMGTSAASSSQRRGDELSAGAGGASAGASTADPTGPSGGGAGGLDEDSTERYQRITLTEDMLHANVRKRLLEEVNRDSKDFALRATEWSEPSPWINVSSTASEFYAGDLVREGLRTMRLGTDAVVFLSEPVTRLVAGVWSDKFHTLVPSKREVLRGDLLNFVADRAHVLHPRDYRVLRVDQEPIRTNGIVVDIMGGGELPSTIPQVPVYAPTDVLVMDGAGNFHVRNSLDDLKSYRHALFLEDEKAEYGRPRPARDQNQQGAGN